MTYLGADGRRALPHPMPPHPHRDVPRPLRDRGKSPRTIDAYLARFTAHRPDTRHRAFREVRCFCTWLRAAATPTTTPSAAPQCPPAPQSRAAPGARRDRPCSPAAMRRRPWAAVIARSSSRSWTPASAVPKRSSWTSRTAPGRSGGCASGTARAARTVSCPSPVAVPTPSPPIARTAVPPRAPSSSRPAPRASRGGAPPAERTQATAAAPQPRRRHPQGARSSLPPHLRHLGHRPRRAGDRRPASARPQLPGDGAPLQRHLRQRPGRRASRR